ncbi:LysR substrate-binding domain-containing protein [Methylobacterium oryzae CBMB20]
MRETASAPRRRSWFAALERARRETGRTGERAGASLAIAATHALSFTFFPGWIRRCVQFEALGALNLISDSMAACEAIMLAGEVQFLLCHHRADAPTRLDDGRFESVGVGRDTLVPALRADYRGGAALAAGPAGSAGPVSRLRERLRARPDPGGERRRGRPRDGLHVPSRGDAHDHGAGGDGVAWLPLTLAEEALARGQLVRAGPATLDVPVEIRLFRSPGEPDRRRRCAVAAADHGRAGRSCALAAGTARPS